MRNVKDFKAIKAVYAYYFPEVRKIVDGTLKDRKRIHETLLQSVNPGLDDYHIPIIKRFISARMNTVPAFKDFKYWYPTSGSSEGIFHFLNRLRSFGVSQIYTGIGEYEGYGEYAKTFGMECYQTSLSRLSGDGTIFISNPSAVDGNIIPNDVINEILDSGHKVFYDLAYLGSTRKYRFDLSHPNIIGGCVSFSKPYGLFYHRAGFTFSREPIKSLYGNKWFKNIPTLMIIDSLLRADIGEDPSILWRTYRPIQDDIITRINKRHDIDIRQSNSFILGYIHGRGPRELRLRNFRRGDGYRFCLTPYFEEREMHAR